MMQQKTVLTKYILVVVLFLRFAALNAQSTGHGENTVNRAPQASATRLQQSASVTNQNAQNWTRAALEDPANGQNWLNAWEWTARWYPVDLRDQKLKSLYASMISNAPDMAETWLIRFLHTHETSALQKAFELAGDAAWLIPYRLRYAYTSDLLQTWRQSHPVSTTAREVYKAVLQSAPSGAVIHVKGLGEWIPLISLQQLDGLRPDVKLVATDSACDCVGEYLTLGTPEHIRNAYKSVQIDGMLLRIGSAVSMEAMIERMEGINWPAILQLQKDADSAVLGQFDPSLRLIVEYLEKNRDSGLALWKARQLGIQQMIQSAR